MSYQSHVTAAAGTAVGNKSTGFDSDAKIEVMKTYGWVFDPVPYLQWGHLAPAVPYVKPWPAVVPGFCLPRVMAAE